MPLEDGTHLKVVVNFSLTIPVAKNYYTKLGGSLEGISASEEENLLKFDELYKKLRDKVLEELGSLKAMFSKLQVEE